MKYFIANVFAKLLDMVFLQKYLPGVPIIFYHAIGDSRSKLFVSAETFERQMQWLARRGYRSVLPTELKDVTHKDKVFLITFDDGFKSVHDVAWPILQKYGFRATVFIATDYIGKQSSYTNDASNRNLDLMTAHDIQALNTAGWCIANHCASHRNLTTLSHDVVCLEYCSASDTLERMRLGKYKHIVAYPFNRYNTTVITILRQQGVVMGFNGGNRLYTKIENHLALPRFEIDNNLARFSLIFSPSFYSLKRMLYRYAR